MTRYEIPLNRLQHGAGEGGEKLGIFASGYVNGVKNTLSTGLNSGQSYASIMSNVNADAFNLFSKLKQTMEKTLVKMDTTYYPKSMTKVSYNDKGDVDLSKSNVSAVGTTVTKLLKAGAVQSGNNIDHIVYTGGVAIANTVLNIHANLEGGGINPIDIENILKKGMSILVYREGNQAYLTPLFSYDRINGSNDIDKLTTNLNNYSSGTFVSIKLSKSNPNGYINALVAFLGNYSHFSRDINYRDIILEQNKPKNVLLNGGITYEDLWLTSATLSLKSIFVTGSQVDNGKRVSAGKIGGSIPRDIKMPVNVGNLNKAIQNLTRLSTSVTFPLLKPGTARVATEDISFTSRGFITGLRALGSTDRGQGFYKSTGGGPNISKEPKYEIETMPRVFVRGVPTQIYVYGDSDSKVLEALTMIYGGEPNDIQLSKREFQDKMYPYNLRKQQSIRNDLNRVQGLLGTSQQQGFIPQQQFTPPQQQQGFVPQQGFAPQPQQGFTPPQQGFAPQPQQGFTPPQQGGTGLSV